MTFEGNRTTRNTSKPANTEDGTDIQTYRHTDIFFIVVLGLWEANKTTKKILARSEKKTYGNHYGNICPEFFGHIKSENKVIKENLYIYIILSGISWLCLNSQNVSKFIIIQLKYLN